MLKYYRLYQHYLALGGIYVKAYSTFQRLQWNYKEDMYNKIFPIEIFDCKFADSTMFFYSALVNGILMLSSYDKLYMLSFIVRRW